MAVKSHNKFCPVLSASNTVNSDQVLPSHFQIPVLATITVQIVSGPPPMMGFPQFPTYYPMPD